MKNNILLPIILFALFIFANTSTSAYAGHKWNNPGSQKNYNAALRESSRAYQNSANAYNNYDRQLGRVEKDVRRVRDGAYKGAFKAGGPGAAWGAAKGAGSSLYERGRDKYNGRNRK